MPSRRTFLIGMASGVSATAGCLGSEQDIAHCSSRGDVTGSELRRIAPIDGDEQVALGILVSSEAVGDDPHNVIEVRDSDETLITSIPLAENREMNQLDQSNHPIFASAEGELYAVVLGPPPVHGVLTASLVTSEGEQLSTATLRFNCYSNDGSLP